ncbi:hypothetical protein BDZ88DRAFT_442085 [Geranomyces variabilis]|nr:hypothetical protein BDZ88DRAFT_442085 [Geranomyces variabilis]
MTAASHPAPRHDSRLQPDVCALLPWQPSKPSTPVNDDDNAVLADTFPGLSDGQRHRFGQRVAQPSPIQSKEDSEGAEPAPAIPAATAPAIPRATEEEIFGKYGGRHAKTIHLPLGAIANNKVSGNSYGGVIGPSSAVKAIVSAHTASKPKRPLFVDRVFVFTFGNGSMHAPLESAFRTLHEGAIRRVYLSPEVFGNHSGKWEPIVQPMAFRRTRTHGWILKRFPTFLGKLSKPADAIRAGIVYITIVYRTVQPVDKKTKTSSSSPAHVAALDTLSYSPARVRIKEEQDLQLAVGGRAIQHQRSVEQVQPHKGRDHAKAALINISDVSPADFIHVRGIDEHCLFSPAPTQEAEDVVAAVRAYNATKNIKKTPQEHPRSRPNGRARRRDRGVAAGRRATTRGGSYEPRASETNLVCKVPMPLLVKSWQTLPGLLEIFVFQIAPSFRSKQFPLLPPAFAIASSAFVLTSLIANLQEIPTGNRSPVFPHDALPPGPGSQTANAALHWDPPFGMWDIITTVAVTAAAAGLLLTLSAVVLQTFTLHPITINVAKFRKVPPETATTRSERPEPFTASTVGTFYLRKKFALVACRKSKWDGGLGRNSSAGSDGGTEPNHGFQGTKLLPVFRNSTTAAAAQARNGSCARISMVLDPAAGTSASYRHTSLGCPPGRHRRRRTRRIRSDVALAGEGLSSPCTGAPQGRSDTGSTICPPRRHPMFPLRRPEQRKSTALGDPRCSSSDEKMRGVATNTADDASTPGEEGRNKGGACSPLQTLRYGKPEMATLVAGHAMLAAVKLRSVVEGRASAVSECQWARGDQRGRISYQALTGSSLRCSGVSTMQRAAGAVIPADIVGIINVMAIMAMRELVINVTGDEAT